jgi:UDP-N-acetylmuramate-alanine ligase
MQNCSVPHGGEGVAIAGTHGKSTTTGLTAHIFREAGLSPSFIIGARSDQLGGSSGLGKGRHLIVESCEFNRSFLQFRPFLAAILNIEPDHLDCYRDIEEITEAFTEFARRVHPRGFWFATRMTRVRAGGRLLLCRSNIWVGSRGGLTVKLRWGAGR